MGLCMLIVPPSCALPVVPLKSEPYGYFPDITTKQWMYMCDARRIEVNKR